MTQFTPESTVKEVKAYLKENWDKGVTCFCCSQRVQRYKRPITSSMALALILICKEGTPNFIHIESFFKTKQGIPSSLRGDVSKLRYWGLLKPSEDNEGEYKITDRGIDFAKGLITVQSHCLLYNNKCYGLTGEQVNIKHCLKTKFDYNLLMQGVL